MSRAWTQEEVQSKFLQHMHDLVRYWEKEAKVETLHERLNGLMFSVLVALDGCSNDLPAYEVIPVPHASDKSLHEEDGDNYYQPFRLPDDAITVHGGWFLHDLWYEKVQGAK